MKLNMRFGTIKEVIYIIIYLYIALRRNYRHYYHTVTIFITIMNF